MAGKLLPSVLLSDPDVIRKCTAFSLHACVIVVNEHEREGSMRQEVLIIERFSVILHALA